MKGATVFVWNDHRMLVRYFPHLSVADVHDSDELQAMLTAIFGKKVDEDVWQCVPGQLSVNLGDCELRPFPQQEARYARS